MPWVFMTYLWGSVSSAVVDCCCTIVIVSHVFHGKYLPIRLGELISNY